MNRKMLNVLVPWAARALEDVVASTPYLTIEEFYKGKKAARSGLPYINHIDEGLLVMASRGASETAMHAYCLHPLVQADTDLIEHLHTLNDAACCFPPVEALVMEYRSVANEYLSKRVIADMSEIRLSPLTAVNDMLVADKVQNYKDFVQYHLGTHPRSDALERYFWNWLTRLDIGAEEVVRLHNLIDDAKRTKEEQHG